MDSDALRRHSSTLTDEALKEALGAGPGAYQPHAWEELTRLAAGRGTRYVGPAKAGGPSDDAAATDADNARKGVRRD
jgi:hypothetical protein